MTNVPSNFDPQDLAATEAEFSEDSNLEKVAPRPLPLLSEDADERVRRAYREIVRYEQEIGDLCAKLNAKDGQISKLELEVANLRLHLLQSNIDTTKQLVSVVLQNISMTNVKFQHLTDILLALVLKDKPALIAPEELKEAIQDSRSFSDLVTSLATGEKTEVLISSDLVIHEANPPILVGMKALFDYMEVSGEQLPVTHLTETEENSLHGLRMLIPGVLAQEFRAVSFFVKDVKGTFLRIRVRLTEATTTRAEVTIHLATGQYGAYFNSNSLAFHSVTLTRHDDDWIEVTFRTSLAVEPAAIELLLLGVGALETKSNRYAGTPLKGFSIRSVKVEKFDGYSTEPGGSELTTPAEEKGVQKMVVELKMPLQERRRAELRAEYLSSGEYGRIAGLRGIHAGKRAFIIGNGPSIQNQDLTLLKSEVTFVTNWFVNHPQMAEIDPTYYCVSSHEMFGGWGNPKPAVNKDWYQRMANHARGTTKFFAHRFADYINGNSLFPAESVYYLLFDLPKYQIDQKQDLNLDLSQPMDDGYTGITTFCMPLAHFMGIKEIYLLGCDCDYGLTSPEAPKKYFYDFKLHTTATTTFDSLQRAWSEDGPVFRSYEVVRRRFALDNIEIVNCTDGGRLEIFPRARYEDVIGRPSA